MAAVTSTIVALGGVGISAVNAIKAGKDKKKADAAAMVAENAMRNVKEQNMMKQVQVPTLGYDLAQEAQAQRDVSQISALQGAGAAGVIGGIGKVAQAGADADLKLAAAAGQQQYQRDLAVGQTAQGIEGRRAGREFGIEQGKLAGAQAASQDAQLRKQQGIEGMFSGLLGAAGGAQLAGQAIEGIDGLGTFQDYLKSLGGIQQTNMRAQAGASTTQTNNP